MERKYLSRFADKLLDTALQVTNRGDMPGPPKQAPLPSYQLERGLL